ncbi:hypothetical protein SAMN05216275_15120 [Streptosporangium canum]|uniref:Uncharacterized protein n=1 Tax=Streptosporangium canum TaxID=324952 RepID=A0A1I4ERV9_9ACTN|nr:hypothetical protein SAMN05216275_15120 [Streptosporangium canum]
MRLTGSGSIEIDVDGEVRGLVRLTDIGQEATGAPSRPAETALRCYRRPAAAGLSQVAEVSVPRSR